MCVFVMQMQCPIFLQSVAVFLVRIHSLAHECDHDRECDHEHEYDHDDDNGCMKGVQLTSLSLRLSSSCSCNTFLLGRTSGPSTRDARETPSALESSESVSESHHHHDSTAAMIMTRHCVGFFFPPAAITQTYKYPR